MYGSGLTTVKEGENKKYTPPITRLCIELLKFVCVHVPVKGWAIKMLSLLRFYTNDYHMKNNETSLAKWQEYLADM